MSISEIFSRESKWKSVFIFSILFYVTGPLSFAEAFDVKGLQPLPPYGVFSTFSAESLRENKAGIGLTGERSYGPDFYRTTLHLAYGFYDNVELTATLPRVYFWEHRVDGFEDTSLGIKHRLFDEGPLTPALAYMLTGELSSGRHIFSTDGAFGGGLVLTKKIGPFKGHLNGFYSNPLREGLHDEYLLNAGLELAVTHNSRLLAELAGRKNFFREKIDLLEWRIGYRIATTDYISTTIGAGFDTKRRSPDCRLLFSVSVVLPKEKKKLERRYEE